MLEVVLFLTGLFLGGIATMFLMACLQINRINDYQERLHKLEQEIENKN